MRSRPRGAVMIMGLAFIATLAISLFFLSQSAVLTNDKIRSGALADASAKSVATWYAQILNYDAYSNRAIAANEIMMAQAVTIAAWTQYVQALSSNLGSVAAVIPAVQPVAQWIVQAATVSHEMAKAGALIEVPIRSGYTRALQTSQQIMHTAATPFAAQAMVNEVIWTADQRFFGQIIPSSNISGFSSFSKNYSADERQGLATLIRQSQDSFTRQRNDDDRLYLLPTTGCIPTSIDRAFGKLIKRGGTWLTADLSNWESADTLSIHTWRRRSRWNRTCGGIGESIALGWGASDAALGSVGGIKEDPVGNGANPGAFDRARSGAVQIPGYLGLSAHRELSPALAQARQGASIRVPVLVRLPKAKLTAITAGQKVQHDPLNKSLGGAIWSLSVAETSFLRPVDTLSNSATREFGNLFSPFWISRLVGPDAADRSVAMLLAQGKSSP